jgi:hypothetical protein
MDVWTYFAQRERECAELSVAFDDSLGPVFYAEEGSDDKRGRIFGRVVLTESAFLQVHEVVVVEDNHVTREEYAYYLILDGVEIWGYERDPTHEPPVHVHLGSHAAVEEAEPVFVQGRRRASVEGVEHSGRDPGGVGLNAFATGSRNRLGATFGHALARSCRAHPRVAAPPRHWRSWSGER